MYKRTFLIINDTFRRVEPLWYDGNFLLTRKACESWHRRNYHYGWFLFIVEHWAIISLLSYIFTRIIFYAPLKHFLRYCFTFYINIKARFGMCSSWYTSSVVIKRTGLPFFQWHLCTLHTWHYQNNSATTALNAKNSTAAKFNYSIRVGLMTLIGKDTLRCLCRAIANLMPADNSVRIVRKINNYLQGDRKIPNIFSVFKN